MSNNVRNFVDIEKNIGVLTTTQRDALLLKETGMICYNITAATFQKYNGTTWDDIGGGATATAQQISHAWKNDANATVGTRRIQIQKVGSVVNLTLEPLSGHDLLGTLSNGGSALYAPAGTIPAGYCPQDTIAQMWNIIVAGSTTTLAWIKISPDGSMKVGTDKDFADFPAQTNSNYGLTFTYSVTAWT